MPEIKAREAASPALKALDKSAVTSRRMKDALIKAKQKTEYNTRAKESSPEEYAADEVTEAAESGVYMGAHVIRETVYAGMSTAERVKKGFEERKAEQPREYVKEKVRKAREEAREAAKAGSLPVFDSEYSRAEPEAFSALPSPEIQSSQSGAQRASNRLRSSPFRQQELKANRARSSDSVGRVSSPGSVSYSKSAERLSHGPFRRSAPNQQAKQAAIRSAAQTAQRNTFAAKKVARESAQASKHAAEAVAKAARAAAAESKALVSAVIAGGSVAVFIILLVVLLGLSVVLFGRRSGNSSYTPVSPEVEAYTPIISIYAKQHGIPEYVELIKAIMMQESRGLGSDPMQCSESGYNTRYPRTPGGITDPEYSIDVGVQTIADVLHMAEVESPIDLDHISLALQGYNYGSGYISWALSKYGGYSELNAIEFSEMMAARNGWEGYGDRAYVSHVLQYYPLGRIFFGEGNQAIVEVARSQIGNEGGLMYCEWYGYPYRVEWCAIFVSWCAEQCGFLSSDALPKMEGVLPYIEWFRARDQWQGRDYEPMSGDLIFYDWEGDGIADHVGIVDRVEAGIVYSIEGNANDRCIENSHYLGTFPIYGYGCPAY